MKKFWTICLTVVMLFVGNAFGNIIDNNWDENLNFKGIHLSASARNQGDVAYANCWGRLEQGVEGRYYKYEYSNMSFSTNQEDTSEFYFYTSWNFLILPLDNYVPDLSINASQYSNFDAFGVWLSMQSDVRNNIEWVAKEPGNPKSEWYPVITDDIQLSSYFNLKPARITNINLSVNEWIYGVEDQLVQNFLGVSFNGRGYFVAETEEEADALGAMFAIPEPATAILLGIGGFLLRNRKYS